MRWWPTSLLWMHMLAWSAGVAVLSNSVWRAGFSTLGLLAALAVLAPLALAPRYSLVGVLAYVLTAYSLPRYGESMAATLDVHMLHVLATLAATGGLAWWAQRPKSDPTRVPWPVLVMGLFLGWAALSAVANADNSTELDARHHPAQLLHAGVLLMLAWWQMRDSTSRWLLLAALLIAPLLRALLQGSERLYLESDLPALSAMVLPLVLLALGQPLHWVVRALLGAAGSGLVWIILATENRGAGVGLALGLLVLWINSRRKAWALVATILVAVALAPWVSQSYLDRFSVVWNPRASHATAELDRATIQERLQLWRAAIQAIRDRPLLGAGPGREVQALSAQRVGEGRLAAHNSVLSAAVETGVIGSALFLLLFVGTVVQLQLLIRQSSDAEVVIEARMVQAALCAYLGIGQVLSRYDMPLAYLFIGWACAVHWRAGVNATSKRISHPPVVETRRAPVRFDLGLGLAAYAAFVLYGSLVPLQFSPRDLGAAWYSFWQLPMTTLGHGDRNDWVVNFLLLMPLGFGLRHALAWQSSSWQGWLLDAGIVAALTLFGLTIEFLQMFFSSRTPSFNDVLAQWLGVVAGLLLHRWQDERFDQWFERWHREGTPRGRVKWLLGAYLLGMLVFAVMPMDFSLSPVDLYRKWRDGRVVLLPFGRPSADVAAWIYEWCSDVVLWIPVGLLWQWQYPSRSAWSTLCRVLFAAAAVEFAQLLVISRVSDTTDVLLAGLGGLVGARIAARLTTSDPIPLHRVKRVARIVLPVWLAMLLAFYWWPFDFEFGRLTAGVVEALQRAPLSAYYERNEFGALNELIRKPATFLPGGLLIALGLSRWPRHWALHWAPWLLMFLALLIEIGQLMLPGRVGDPTDAVLQTSGGWLGLALARWLLAPSNGEDST